MILIRRWAAIPIAALGLVTAAQSAAQQRTDSLSTRPDYRDLNELLAALPAATAPAFAETAALWMGSLPLSCLDRLQPRPGRAGGTAPAGMPGAARAGGALDSLRQTGAAAAADATGRAAGAVPRGDPAAAAGRAGGAAPPDAADAQRAGGAGRGTLSGSDYFWTATYRLIPNYKTTRAFWGCTDWHSAVSSTWVTARLLREYPKYGLHELAREKLNDHLGKSNIEGELAFFRNAAGNFERPYGYAWLLKLQAELRVSADSQAKRWAANVAPLATWMADSLVAHLNAMPRPVHTGTLANTALTLNLALDYAEAAAHTRLRSALQAVAIRFYATDRECDTQAEAAAGIVRGAAFARAGGAAGQAAAPGRAGAAAADSVGQTGRAGGAANVGPAGRAGAAAADGGRGGRGAAGTADLLSPCLAEAALMARVLPPVSYRTWLDAFLPPLQSGRFAALTEAPGASAQGNERVRLSALALQRAYAFERIARGLPANDARQPVLRRLANLHASRGFELLRHDTLGSHWLPAFALLYITIRQPAA